MIETTPSTSLPANADAPQSHLNKQGVPSVDGENVHQAAAKRFKGKGNGKFSQKFMCKIYGLNL